jgi:hypothetical protein
MAALGLCLAALALGMAQLGLRQVLVHQRTFSKAGLWLQRPAAPSLLHPMCQLRLAAGALGSTTLQTTSNDVAGIDYFVWNNGGSPINNSAWNYFANFGDARFDAVINASGAVPEPATWAMMLLGFGLVGGAMRRRKSAAQLALA